MDLTRKQIMNNKSFNKKGAQLERVHISSTQVVDTRAKRRQRGTKMEIDYKVKRNNADEEQKFLITEIVNNKLEKQKLYEKRQNHTFIEPKLNLITKQDIKIKKVLRGNERAATHKFMKEMVESNKIQPSWNVEYAKGVDKVDLFFMKKKTKPFSGFSIKELRDSLIVQPDDKNIVQLPAMNSINETVAPCEEISVSAISAQLAALMAKLDKLEKINEELVRENKQLRFEHEQHVNIVHEEVKEQIKPQEVKPQTIKKTQQKSLGVNLKITKTKIIGQEESFEIENTQTGKFEDKPQKPQKPNKKMLGRKLQNNIRTWYTYDNSELVEHQKEVLNSIVTNTTFANKIREIGIPKQKIRYTKSPIVKEEPKNIHFYGYKPKGIPNKIWWHWVTTVTAPEAYEKANKFLYNQFKREMFIYRTKWVKYSKEFNPYLSEPKMVWSENTSEFQYDTGIPYEFILKWRQLVQTYKPSKPISVDWYKISQKQ